MKKICFIFFALSTTSIYCQDDAIDEKDYQASLALYEESKLLIAEGKYEQATDFLQQAHEFFKGNSDYTYAAAFALYKLERYEEASKKIDWSLSLEPFQSDYYVVAGNIAYKRELFVEGIGFYTKALIYQDSTEVPIDDLNCLYNRGNCYLNNEEYSLAENDYSTLLDVDNNNYMAFHNRAQARVRMGKNKLACEDWHAAIDTGSKISQKYISKYCTP